MFCTKCGTRMAESSKFCPQCGSHVNPVKSATVTTPAYGTPPAGVPIAENIPAAPPASAPIIGNAPISHPEQAVPFIPIDLANLSNISNNYQGDLSTLPEKVRHNCAVCNQETSGSDMFVTVISGIQTNIGKGKDKKDLYHKEPNMKNTAPICSRCNEDGVSRIKKMRPLNCILAILFWPIGIALFIGGIVLFFSDYLWIPLGSIQIKPYIFAFILCIPGILVISLAVRFGKRGFSKPEKVLILDAEKKFKARVLNELKEDSGYRNSAFVATMKEAANLQKQNAVARKACKYPLV